MKSRQRVLKILDQSLSVKTEADEAHVEAVEALVNQRIREVLDKNKTASVITATLLACLNIADELLTQKNLTVQNKQKAAARVRDMIELVDACLAQESPELPDAVSEVSQGVMEAVSAL